MKKNVKGDTNIETKRILDKATVFANTIIGITITFFAFCLIYPFFHYSVITHLSKIILFIIPHMYIRFDLHI